MSTTPKAITRKGSNARGFTLIELLVAIAILGILSTIVINEIWDNIHEARVTGTETKLQSMRTIVENYRRKNLRLPRDLRELLEPDPRNFGRPWISNEDSLIDTWGNPMLVREIDNGDFEVVSFGDDGSEGGENLAQDLSSNKSTQAPNNTNR